MYSDYHVGLYFIAQIESMLKLERENVIFPSFTCCFTHECDTSNVIYCIH